MTVRRQEVSEELRIPCFFLVGTHRDGTYVEVEGPWTRGNEKYEVCATEESLGRGRERLQCLTVPQGTGGITEGLRTSRR